MIEATTSPSKKSILDAAQKLLVKYGYAGLSMRELADECGLAKATIYHYFQDKQDIVLSVIERDIATMRDCLLTAAGQEDDVIEKIRAIIRTQYVMMRERRALMMSVIREIDGLETQLHELKRRHVAAFCRPLAKIIEDGIAQGVFRPANVEMTVISLFGMIYSVMTHCALISETDIGDNLIDHTLSLFLYGMVNPTNNNINHSTPNNGVVNSNAATPSVTNKKGVNHQN